MSVIIPRDIRTNPTSTAVWLASRRRNRLRGGGFNPPVIPGLTVGKTTESGLTFYGFGLGVGSLLPAEFLTTGQNITRLGALDISDFADNGDFANNGDFALATFEKLILGDGLPDVGSVEVTINGITTTATFNNGSYESTDANAEAIYNLLKSNVGTTYSFDVVENTPQGNLIVGDFSSLTGDPSSSAYAAPSQTGGASIGSLNPPILLNGSPLEILYAINVDLGAGAKKYVLMGDATGSLAGRVNTTFNGVPYTFDALPGLGTTPTIQSDTLYDFLFNNRGTPIVFTAEAVAPPSSQITISTGTYSNGQPVAGYGVGVLQGGGDLGSISPPLLLDGQVVTELSIRNNNNISYPNTVTAAGATDIGDLFLNIGTETFTLQWLSFRYVIPGGQGGQQQQQFYDFLVANDGATLPISITDTALFSVVI